MVKKKGAALLVVLTDVGPEHDAEFNSWYNEEHLPERLSAPGFLDAARYEALRGSPRYLAIYELESVDALHTEEYMRMSNNPTEWTKRMSPNIVGRAPCATSTLRYTRRRATRIPWAAAWRPLCRLAAWTCRRNWKPNITSITTPCALPPIWRYPVVCTSVATMPSRAPPST